MDDFSVHQNGDNLNDDFALDAFGLDDIPSAFGFENEEVQTLEVSQDLQTLPFNDLFDLDDSPFSLDVDPIWSDTPTLTPDGGSSHSFPDEIQDVREDPKTDDFRRKARVDKPPFPITWMDQDDSGNYEELLPENETKDNRTRCQVTNKRKRENETRSDDETGESLRLDIVMKVRTESALLRFANIVSQGPSLDEPVPVEKYGGYRLRRRDSTKAVNESLPFSPDLNLPDDLTGHPCARGCRACLKYGFNCSLLQDGESWPCSACTEDRHDCELITSPKVKISCERCRRLKMPCSFRSVYEQGESCQQCLESEQHCYAGPAKDWIRPRLRYDWNWKEDPTRLKKALRLLESPTPIPPADHDRLRYLSQAGLMSTGKHKSTKNITNLKTKEIKTKFCHPIRFNHIDTTNKQPCHFCAEPSYAILGLAEQRVSVIEYKHGKGLKEVIGGHKAEGVENTRVCPACTMARMQIVLCPVCPRSAMSRENRQLLTHSQKHEVVPFEHPHETVHRDAALLELLSGAADLANKWCALCPSLASYQCCTVSDGCPCGLLLCEHVMVLLTGAYDGNLQEMLRRIIDEQSNERPLGLRADHGLLKEDGLLMRYVLGSSQ